MEEIGALKKERASGLITDGASFLDQHCCKLPLNDVLIDDERGACWSEIFSSWPKTAPRCRLAPHQGGELARLNRALVPRLRQRRRIERL